MLLAPVLADAKAGGGSSIGSRGSKTFQPNAAKPIERSIAPPPVMAPAPAIPPNRIDAPARPPGFFQRHPFLGGMLGGFAGAGIGALLFGGHMFGGGLGGILSLLLQIALIVFLVRLAIGYFRGRSSPAEAAAGQSYSASPQLSLPAQQAANPIGFALSEIDLSTFERLLIDIQAAWTKGDGAALYRLTTPEMAGYMEEQLRDNSQRGLQNRVEQVRLVKGDVQETWQEGSTDYATVTLTWSATDYMVRAGGHEVVAGDPQAPVLSTEVWTLVRLSKGPWQLSAIQQV